MESTRTAQRAVRGRKSDQIATCSIGARRRKGQAVIIVTGRQISQSVHMGIAAHHGKTSESTYSLESLRPGIAASTLLSAGLAAGDVGVVGGFLLGHFGCSREVTGKIGRLYRSERRRNWRCRGDRGRGRGRGVVCGMVCEREEAGVERLEVGS